MVKLKPKDNIWAAVSQSHRNKEYIQYGVK